MTKTITELQPLIYASLFAQPERRESRRRQWRRLLRAGVPALYSAIGLKIALDTGLAPWDWRFWLIFAPLFFGAERVLAPLIRASDLQTRLGDA